METREKRIIPISKSGMQEEWEALKELIFSCVCCTINNERFTNMENLH